MNNIAIEYIQKYLRLVTKQCLLLKPGILYILYFLQILCTFSLFKSQLLIIKLELKYISLKYFSVSTLFIRNNSGVSSVFMKMGFSFDSDNNFGDIREYSSIDFLVMYLPNLPIFFF